ncbi:MAG: type II toxin-antitoxin system Phd/YefM family antitoxin [Sulfuricellaceae bacterium]
MHKLSITALRQRLSQVADEVLDSGVPVAIEHRGRTLLLVAENAGKSRLAALKRRKLIKGAADRLVDAKVGGWREPKDRG